MTRLILAILAVSYSPAVYSEEHGGLILAGCITETGELFALDVYGDGTKGKIFAVSQRGTTCAGDWWTLRARRVFASLKCEDGRSTSVDIALFDPRNPKINANARMSDGTTLAFWNVEPAPRCWRNDS